MKQFCLALNRRGGGGRFCSPSWFFLNNFQNSAVSLSSLSICDQNLILHILNKFHGDAVIHTKIMAVLSTGTSGISNVSDRHLQKKETAVILKRIDQLPQDSARIHNIKGSFDRSHKIFKFFYSSYCFHCFLLFIYCLSFIPNLILHQRYKMFTYRKI